jgi:hypothetical protein
MIIHFFKKKEQKKVHCRNKPVQTTKNIFHDENYKNYVIQRPGSTENFFSTVHENPPGIRRSQNTVYIFKAKTKPNFKNLKSKNIL